MHYREVAKLIKQKGYKRVLVTGPQRSGTTITGKIMAQELGFKYIDEMAIQVDNFDKMFSIYHEQRNFVLQAPGLAAYAHMMPGAVCFMRRPVKDIIKSQDRINWVKSHQKELAKYFKTEGEISEIKYAFWDVWQKKHPNMFEIDYSSIADHELYVAPEHRKNFKPRQTKR